VRLARVAEGRAARVFQPVAVATFAMCALWLGLKGDVSTNTLWLFLLGLPVLLAGTWVA